MNDDQPTARVARVFRYPVKGLGAERLDSAPTVAGGGIVGDRAVALSNGTRAPADGWDGPGSFTALKNESSGAAYGTSTAANGCITITTPVGETLEFDPRDADSRRRAGETMCGWFAAQGHEPRALARAEQGMFDSRKSGLSLINLATVRLLGEVAGEDLDPLRFRGNLYLDGLPPFAEFGLVGQRLRIGGVVGIVSKPIERCQATAVNPSRGVPDVPVPRLLTRYLGHLHCGVYLQVERAGIVRAGDAAQIIGSDPGSPEVPDSTAPRIMRMASSTPVGGGVNDLVLEDPRGIAGRLYVPGQHLRVHLLGEDGPLWRSYTITRAEGSLIHLSIRVFGPASRMLASMTPGEPLLASGPFGTATLTEAQRGRRIAVLTAGIGITPALGLLSGLADTPRPDWPAGVRLAHVERSPSPLAGRLADSVGALGGRGLEAELRTFITSRGPRPGEDEIRWALDGAHEVFVCGPASFMSSVTGQALARGIPARAIHREAFVSPAAVKAELVAASPATIRIGAESVPWTPEAGTVLESLEASGHRLPNTCRGGSCGTCALRITDGDVDYPIEPTAPRNADEVLICSAYPRGDISFDPPPA